MFKVKRHPSHKLGHYLNECYDKHYSSIEKNQENSSKRILQETHVVFGQLMEAAILLSAVSRKAASNTSQL